MNDQYYDKKVTDEVLVQEIQCLEEEDQTEDTQQPVIASLAKNTTLMFVATSITNVLNYVFHIYMGRSLGPSGYGTLVALMSVLVVFSVPFNSLQTVVVKYASFLAAKNRFGNLSYFLDKLARRILVFTVPAFLVFIGVSGYLAEFLKMQSRMPIILIGIVIITGFFSPLMMGAIQGLQRFGYLAASSITSGTIKLVFGIVLVSFGFGVSGAIISLAAATIGAMAITLVPLRFIFSESKDPTGLNKTEIWSYFWPVLGVSLLLAVLTSIDIVTVKHYFSPEAAGNYAAAAIFGKIVLFVPGAIGVVMFPKVSELHAQGREHRIVLRNALAITAALCASVTAVYFIYPSLIVSTLFGSSYENAIPIMGSLGIAMTIFAMIQILALYSLSIHDFKFLIWLIFGVVIELALFLLSHQTLMVIINAMILSGTVILVPSMVMAFLKRKSIEEG